MSDFMKGFLLGMLYMFLMFPTRVLEWSEYCTHHGYVKQEVKNEQSK